MAFMPADPTEWRLEISPNELEAVWRDRPSLSTPGRCWSAYLNQVCLSRFLPWLQTEYIADATVWPDAENLHSFWEVVDGFAITAGGKRWVLLPSESLDKSELVVPQEWVDIPEWVADYYFPVQVDLEQPALRIWGYATHQQLKTAAQYDASDRTYCLDGRQLTQDLTVFWAAYQFCPDEPTRALVSALPKVFPSQIEGLLQQLGDPAVTFPRLAASFPFWGALLSQPTWRRQLFKARQGAKSKPLVLNTTPVNLNQWFQAVFINGWQPLEKLCDGKTQRLATCFRSHLASNLSEVKGAKLIGLDCLPKDSPLVLLVGLRPEANEKTGVQVQIHPTSKNPYVPENLRLTLLSESGEAL
ncbi:MAG: DUF1822 family protein, partial [Leptolyngbyaceae cyanobacterium MO_188.B28]|nr:DUF1822 family protein [Leptolyngbyaceae cyanobacterium MO_188.B28]